METSFTKTELVTRIRAERARWEALLAGRDEALLTAPAVIGTWSVKDVLAHLMAYQSEFLRAWTHTPRAAPPPGVDMADLDQRNAWLADQYRKWSLADVLAAWREVGERLLTLVAATPSEDLDALVRVTPAFDLVPADATATGDVWRLADLIAGQACAHPDRHYPAVRDWLTSGRRAPQAE
jgi:hypothetical protein